MAEKSKGGNTAAAVRTLAEPIAEQLGLSVWDVTFTKEGAAWYLRVYIDKDGGVDLDDCERMSRAIDEPLDELDPIDQFYYLEVCSPGVERELRIPEHFELMAGREIRVTFIRPIDGEKEVIATLVALRDKEIVMTDLDGTEFSIPQSSAASVRLYDSSLD